MSDIKLLRVGDKQAQENHHVNGMYLHLLAAEAHIVDLKTLNNPKIFVHKPKQMINRAFKQVANCVDFLGHTQNDGHVDLSYDKVNKMLNVNELLFYAGEETVEKVLNLLKSELNYEPSDD